MRRKRDTKKAGGWGAGRILKSNYDIGKAGGFDAS